MTIPVPKGTIAKLVDCRISEARLYVGIRGQEGALVDGELFAKVRTDESFWQIDRAEGVVTVHFEKLDDMNWWECVVKGHVEIDLSKVEPGNSRLGDLDGDTRGMVEKMMYDQRQKAAGLPTSDEKSKMDMFDKFKQEHPEMDFSQAKLQ